MSDSHEGRKSRPGVGVSAYTDVAKVGDRSEQKSEQMLADLLQEVREMFCEILKLLKVKSKEWYTTKEAADQLGLAEYTVRRYVREGRLESVRVTGAGPKGRLLVSRASIDAVMQREWKPIETGSPAA